MPSMPLQSVVLDFIDNCSSIVATTIFQDFHTTMVHVLDKLGECYPSPLVKHGA